MQGSAGYASPIFLSLLLLRQFNAELLVNFTNKFVVCKQVCMQKQSQLKPSCVNLLQSLCAEAKLENY